MKKLKRKLLGMGLACAIGITVYGINYTYVNYQKDKAEQEEKQAKEQRENEQKGKAMDKVQTIVNNRITNMDCKAEYNCTSTTDDYFLITTTFKGIKNTTIDCKIKRVDDSVDFSDFDSFKNTLNKYVSEEQLEEIRHKVIDDYQNILCDMAGANPTWDKVDFSIYDNDYIVQETSDRFYGGQKAYLCTIDSKWITKSGTSEWKHICLHMEYDSNNKLIETKYGNYDKIDPDKDIRLGTKEDNKSTEISATLSTQVISDSKMTADEAKQLILKEDGDYISKTTNKKDKYNYYSKFSSDYKECTADNIPEGWNIPKEACYVFTIDYYDNKGEVLNGVCEYLVGKDSKNIYCLPNQGGMSGYQIKNNKILKTFKWIGEGVGAGATEWRK